MLFQNISVYFNIRYKLISFEFFITRIATFSYDLSRSRSRSKSLVAIYNIASTVDEAHDYKTDAVTATNREPGVANVFVKTARKLLQWKGQE